MQNIKRKVLRMLAPVLGAGAIAVCPLCWAGSAAFLTYIGIGAIIPVWQWLFFLFIFAGLAGFILDYRYHKNIRPIIFLIVGAIILYLGRYVWGGEGFGGWPIWGVGIIIIIIAVWYNTKLFSRGAQNNG